MKVLKRRFKSNHPEMNNKKSEISDKENERFRQGEDHLIPGLMHTLSLN